MNGTLDLFDAAIVPGLSTGPDMLSPAEEADLIARIDAVSLSPFRFQQWTGKRLTHSFGWRYDFETGRFALAERLPDFLQPLRERAAGFVGFDADDLVQALLIRYDPGAGIGWHKDRPVFDHVIGISLGSEVTMRFRQRTADGFKRASVSLMPRSIYHLTGEVRHQWEHSITPMTDTRWSITFRSLSDQGRAAART